MISRPVAVGLVRILGLLGSVVWRLVRVLRSMVRGLARVLGVLGSVVRRLVRVLRSMVWRLVRILGAVRIFGVLRPVRMRLLGLLRVCRLCFGLLLAITGTWEHSQRVEENERIILAQSQWMSSGAQEFDSVALEPATKP